MAWHRGGWLRVPSIRLCCPAAAAGPCRTTRCSFSLPCRAVPSVPCRIARFAECTMMGDPGLCFARLRLVTGQPLRRLRMLFLFAMLTPYHVQCPIQSVDGHAACAALCSHGGATAGSLQGRVLVRSGKKISHCTSLAPAHSKLPPPSLLINVL